jgi:hypothetical protein
MRPRPKMCALTATRARRDSDETIGRSARILAAPATRSPGPVPPVAGSCCELLRTQGSSGALNSPFWPAWLGVDAGCRWAAEENVAKSGHSRYTGLRHNGCRTACEMGYLRRARWDRGS